MSHHSNISEKSCCMLHCYNWWLSSVSCRPAGRVGAAPGRLLRRPRPASIADVVPKSLEAASRPMTAAQSTLRGVPRRRGPDAVAVFSLSEVRCTRCELIRTDEMSTYTRAAGRHDDTD